MRLARTDPATVARAEELLADGQLATWVGEDVGLSRSTMKAITKGVPGRAEHVRAWQQTWAQIRRNPTLVALHREFNPA